MNMSTTVMLPQEVEVWYIIPALRKELTISLKQLGLSQKEIAGKLGITEAAVSQYISGKRGSETEIPESLKLQIMQSAKDIISGKSNLFKEINRLCMETKKTDFICHVHRKYTDLPNNCDLCFR